MRDKAQGRGRVFRGEEGAGVKLVVRFGLCSDALLGDGTYEGAADGHDPGGR
jgi:hypothetical protein